jgi:hypothetical protein
MFRPAWNNPYGFDASGSGDLTLPPPPMLTEAFVAAHTEVLRQLLQTQQQMAQQQPQMPPSTEGSTFQALLTRSTHPEGHKHHCWCNSTVRRAEFHVEPDGVRYYPRTLWETISEYFGRQSLSVLICLYGRTSLFVQSVGTVC